MFEIKRICLDLDGVLNKFHQHVFRHLGFTDYDDTIYPIEAGFEIEAAANAMAGYDKFPTRKEFWTKITREVWATAPKSDEFDLILNAAIKLVGKDNIIILTKPTIDPDCMAGKLEWIQRQCPFWLQRQFLVGPSKQFCARYDTLLVDDADKNTTKFEAAGGMSLLVPRPWNTNSKLLVGLPREDRRLVPTFFLTGAFAEFQLLKEGKKQDDVFARKDESGPRYVMPARAPRDWPQQRLDESVGTAV